MWMIRAFRNGAQIVMVMPAAAAPPPPPPVPFLSPRRSKRTACVCKGSLFFILKVNEGSWGPKAVHYVFLSSGPSAAMVAPARHACGHDTGIVGAQGHARVDGDEAQTGRRRYGAVAVAPQEVFHVGALPRPRQFVVSPSPEAVLDGVQHPRNDGGGAPVSLFLAPASFATPGPFVEGGGVELGTGPVCVARRTETLRFAEFVRARVWRSKGSHRGGGGGPAAGIYI